MRISVSLPNKNTMQLILSNTDQIKNWYCLMKVPNTVWNSKNVKSGKFPTFFSAIIGIWKRYIAAFRQWPFPQYTLP